MKNINNIVFYSSSAESKEERNAVVFYEDGTVKSVSYAEAIMMCEQLAKEMGIKKNAFKEMINRDLIHAVTEEEFLNNFHQYLPQEKVVSLEETEAYKKKRLRYQLGAVGAAALLGLTACAYSSRQGNMTSSNIESTVLASDNGEEETVEDKNGKRKQVTRKLFPSYVFIKMIYSNPIWYLVTQTEGVTGFVGPQGRPQPLTPEEVKRNGLETIKLEDFNIKVGDNVEIISGALTGFIGSVDSIDSEHEKIKVIVSMFGRETPVEIDFTQVEKRK